MFIILGSPRSGTTLLATTLSLHSQVQVIDQTDFIVPMAFILDRIDNAAVGRKMLISLVLGSHYFADSIGKWLNEEDIQIAINSSDYRLDSILTRLYSMMGNKAGKPLCADKSVSDIGYYPILNRVGLFNSQIKIIHLVRDIRAVMCSLERLDWIKDRGAFPRAWSNANLGLHQLLSGNDNYCFLKYEDLVSEPNQHLCALCSFLGLKVEDKMFDSQSRGLEYKKDDYHNHLQEPFMAQNATSWKQTLSLSTQALCEVQAAESLQYFGYK